MGVGFGGSIGGRLSRGSRRGIIEMWRFFVGGVVGVRGLVKGGMGKEGWRRGWEGVKRLEKGEGGGLRGMREIISGGGLRLGRGVGVIRRLRVLEMEMFSGSECPRISVCCG